MVQSDSYSKRMPTNGSFDGFREVFEWIRDCKLKGVSESRRERLVSRNQISEKFRSINKSHCNEIEVRDGKLN